MLHPLGMDGAGQQRTSQKGAQRRGEAQCVRQQHHAEADAQRHDEQRLVAHQLGGLVQQRGQQEDAQHQPQHQIQHQQAQLQRQRAAGDGLTDGDGGQDDHHEDAGDVLHHQCAEHQLGKILLPDVQLVKSLDDDGGGGHGQHAAQKDAVHSAPAHELPHGEAHGQHAAYLHQRGDDGGTAHAGQLVEVEFQAKAEHQDDDADLAPCGHGLAVTQREEKRHVGANEKARQYVAQHQGQVQFFEDNGDDTARQQNDGQIGNKLRQMHLRSPLLNE